MGGFPESGFRESETTGTAVVSLSVGVEKAFSKLKGLSQIRHAIASCVQVRQATSEALPRVLRDPERMDRPKKVCPAPRGSDLQESFRLTKNRRLFLALYEGKIIAGTPVRFYFGSNSRVCLECIAA